MTPDCLEGHEEHAEPQGQAPSDMSIPHPEDWWIAYATSDDEEDALFPGDRTSTFKHALA